MENTRKLYMLSEVIASPSGETIWVTENEKHANLLRNIGVHATTSGLGICPNTVDWNFLKGRKIIIWPINTNIEPKANKFVLELDSILHQLNCSVHVVDVRKLMSTDTTDRTDANKFILDMVNFSSDDTTDGNDAINWLFEHEEMTKEELMAIPLVSLEPNNSSNKMENRSMNSDQPLQTRQGSSQSQTLIELTSDFEFFHSPDTKTYAAVPINSHRENHSTRSKTFSHLLQGRYYKKYGRGLNRNAMEDAVSVFESQAMFEGEQHHVYVRVAEDGGHIYVDLGNKLWQVAKVTPDGWEITQKTPVKFIRPKGMLEFPKPTKGGSIEDLREFINLPEEESWVLLISYLLFSLTSNGPFPILIVQGEQGAAKSTFCRVVRSLIDPATSPLRSMPTNTRDLMLAAQNGWLMAYDNLSGLSSILSDALCRLSTGGGFATRELYSDSDETLFEASRPVCLNGITEFATRDDLLDRALILKLPSIPDDKRVDEKSFWANFEQMQPSIFGGLLDVLSKALRYLPDVDLEYSPRMADFAKFSAAVERAMGWEQGAFISAYNKNRSISVEMSLEADPVAQSILSLMASLPKSEWKNTATQLMEDLEDVVSDTVKRSSSWPKTAGWLSNRVKRLIPSLRTIGIEVEFDREGSGGVRLIAIRKTDKYICVSSVSSVRDRYIDDDPF
jgi:hypothetical protein